MHTPSACPHIHTNCLDHYCFSDLDYSFNFYLLLSILKLKINVPEKYTENEYLYIRYMLINVNETINPEINAVFTR